MIVCHCHGITDRAIRACVSNGAMTPREVVRACRAGGSCGGCVPVVRELVDQERRQAATPKAPAA